MFEQQEQIGHPVGATFLDQIALKRKRVVVTDQPSRLTSSSRTSLELTDT